MLQPRSIPGVSQIHPATSSPFRTGLRGLGPVGWRSLFVFAFALKPATIRYTL